MIRKIFLVLATPPVLFNQFLNPFYILFFSLSKFRAFNEINIIFWIISITTLISFSAQFILNINNSMFSQQGHFLSLIAFFIPLLVLIFKIDLSVEDILHSILYGCLGYSLFFCIILFFVEQPPLTCVGCVKSIDFIGFPQRFISLVVLGSAIAFANLLRRGSLFYGVSFLFLLIPIFFSYTRSIWIEFLATFLFIFIFSFFYLSLKKKLFISSLLILIIFIFLNVFWLYPDSLFILLIKGLFISSFEALRSVFDANSGTIFFSTNSEGQRTYFWKLAIDVFFDYPILGTGLAGLYQFGYPEYGSVHSQWIDHLMRTGLLGLLIYVYFYVEICFQYYKKYPEVTCWVIGLTFFGLFNESTKIISIAMIFFILLNKAIYREV